LTCAEAGTAESAISSSLRPQPAAETPIDAAIPGRSAGRRLERCGDEAIDVVAGPGERDVISLYLSFFVLFRVAGEREEASDRQRFSAESARFCHVCDCEEV
jgi:hypothetical protein